MEEDSPVEESSRKRRRGDDSMAVMASAKFSQASLKYIFSLFLSFLFFFSLQLPTIEDALKKELSTLKVRFCENLLPLRVCLLKTPRLQIAFKG